MEYPSQSIKDSKMQYLDKNLKNDRMISVLFQSKPFNITVIWVYGPTTDAKEIEGDQFYEDLQDLLELTPKKDILFIIGDWNIKVQSKEISGVTGKFVFEVQDETRQRLTELCQENTLFIANVLFQQHKRWLVSGDGHHKMVNTKIILIIFFAVQDREPLYSQQNQVWELTVTQIMNS